MYGRFLTEAATITGDDRLAEIGARFRDLGDAWQVVAEAFRAPDAAQNLSAVSELIAPQELGVGGASGKRSRLTCPDYLRRTTSHLHTLSLRSAMTLSPQWTDAVSDPPTDRSPARTPQTVMSASHCPTTTSGTTVSTPNS